MVVSVERKFKKANKYANICAHQLVTKWSVDSSCHKLSENVWFAWSNTCYKDEKVRCHACPRTDTHTCESRAVFC